MQDLPSTNPPLQPPAATAGRYAAIVAASVLVAALFRRVIASIFSDRPDHFLPGSFLLAAMVGLLWFAFTLVCLRRKARAQHPFHAEANATTAVKMSRVLLSSAALSTVLACICSFTAWSVLALNDEIMDSRTLPWIMPLITVQEYGFSTASKMFPCRAEGFDGGCEAYRTIPAVVVANAVAYLPLLLCLVVCYRLVSPTSQTLPNVAHKIIRWIVPLAALGLCALLVMNQLGLSTYDTLYPSGDSHHHFGIWELLNDLTGTLILTCIFLLPLYLYRSFWRFVPDMPKQQALTDSTSLMALVMVSLILGNVY
jgi:hypothetical protein